MRLTWRWGGRGEGRTTTTMTTTGHDGGRRRNARCTADALPGRTTTRNCGPSKGRGRQRRYRCRRRCHTTTSERDDDEDGTAVAPLRRVSGTTTRTGSRSTLLSPPPSPRYDERAGRRQGRDCRGLQDNLLLIPMLLLSNFFGARISSGTFPKSADHVEISLNVQRNSMYRKICTS